MSSSDSSSESEKTESMSTVSEKREQHLKIVSSYMGVNERELGFQIISDILLIIFTYYFDALLVDFERIAHTGQLFLKYTGKRRRKPQDRIVKVSFDKQKKPSQISWGSGSRHISWGEIQYISWGHWTPVFAARKDHDQLDPDLCLSVVGKQQILDVQAQSKNMAELWVRGLRMLLGQDDETADTLAKQAFENNDLPGSGKRSSFKTTDPKRTEREHKNRTKSLKLLQQDLFVMTTTTVFRNLEAERIWDIDQEVRERFNAKSLYELAEREDIPWRRWNHWVREKVVKYLRANGRVTERQQEIGHIESDVNNNQSNVQLYDNINNNQSNVQLDDNINNNVNNNGSVKQDELMNRNQDNCKQQ